MKFLKYFFISLLPIMLVLMFFSYSGSSFLGSKKAGAYTSNDNVVNFYGKDNYLIGSYLVPSGQSINDVYINESTDVTSSASLYVGSLNYSGSSNTFNTDYSLVVNKVNVSSSDTSLSMVRSNYAFSNTSSKEFSAGVQLNNLESNKLYSYSFDITPYVSTYGTNCYYYAYIKYKMPSNNNLYLVSTLKSNSFTSSSSFSNATTYSLTGSFNSGNISSDNIYYFFVTVECKVDTAYRSIALRCDVNNLNISTTYTDVVEDSLSNIINNDIEIASQNGYIDLYANYSWSRLTNYNDGFDFDTLIFTDTNLYYMAENRYFDFSNGWSDTLGDLSNNYYYTDMAIIDLVNTFQDFNTINFNGNIIDILIATGRAIINVFKCIFAVFKLMVYPIVDAFALLVKLIHRAGSFWTFA